MPPLPRAVALTVFSEYMTLARLLQKTYRQEPAGSQGVWALDDFQFVPFIWGAMQLNGAGKASPSDIPGESGEKCHQISFI